jgi:thiamine biosynthesis lipoprotein
MVRLDEETRSVTLPRRSRLDLGGIAKGWIVDRVADLLAPHGDFLVDAGGDIAARGEGPDGKPGWLVGVADPVRPDHDLCLARLTDQAVATSTTMRRRWRRGGETLHHLIDPRTGRPAASDVLQATVFAGTAMEADVFAKTALILGRESGLDWLTRRGQPALLVTEDALLTTPSWRHYEHRILAC